MSIGTGAGYSGTGVTGYTSSWYGTASDGTVNTQFRCPDGTFDYDAVDKLNADNYTNPVNVSGMPGYKGSLMIMNKASNDHFWTGLISTYTTKFGDYFDFYGGIDFRYYKGLHKNVITDLFGGQYYVDSYNRKSVLAENSVNGGVTSWVNQKLGVGDVIRRDYDGFVMYEGGFAQLEYNKDKVSAFVSGGLTNTSYWRKDRFYYSGDKQLSSKKHYLGGNVKAGLNYNLDDYNNVFFNTGFISRAPIFDNTFINSQSSHERNPDAKNEKVYSFELGYGYRSSWLNVNLNAYYTRWMDKTMTKGGDILDENSNPVDRYSINMQGVDARHMGVELDFVAEPTRWLTINGMLSVGDWQWDSNATGYYYNGQGQPLADLKGTIASDIYAPDHAKSEVQLKGVKVGDSAQLTGALGATVKFLDGFRAGLDYNFYANNYADFALNGSSLVVGGVKTFKDPWKIPSGGQFDFNASYRFKIGSCKATLYGNINNVFNQNIL